MRESPGPGLTPEHGPLTAAERQRLRPSVNIPALERFLAAAPETPRGALIAHFAIEVTPDDLLAFMRGIQVAGEASAAEVDEYERTMREPSPDPAPDGSARAAASSGVRYVPVPHSQYVLRFDPPADPELRALWDAIEPC